MRRAEILRALYWLRKSRCSEVLRAAGFAVNTAEVRVEEIKQEDREGALFIVQRYHNIVYPTGIGCIKTNPIKFEFKKGLSPISPQKMHPIPLHVSFFPALGSVEKGGGNLRTTTPGWWWIVP